METWIRKVKHDFYAVRIAIPQKLIKQLGWELCDYVQITRFGDRHLLLGRCDDGQVDKCGKA